MANHIVTSSTISGTSLVQPEQTRNICTRSSSLVQGSMYVSGLQWGLWPGLYHLCWPVAWAVIIVIVQPKSTFPLIALELFCLKRLSHHFSLSCQNTEKAVANTEVFSMLFKSFFKRYAEIEILKSKKKSKMMREI